MPTPVGVARQCLAQAAAAVLADAVGVAKRRSHSQTTSLHIVSALLALPSSTLREACTRARSSAYSPRLQFRALELCVGVALDRVSVSKSPVEEPPVSNSLMAAIKRSQANQRRHPETFHLYQQQLNSNSQNLSSISAVKVQLKHFVMSILDDPIVSRVFGDAGFRTHEIKLAILNPLTMSRLSSTTSQSPPLFLCSLSDFELNKRDHSFPFSDYAATEKVDNNSTRIAEVLLNKNRKNPLLIGGYASDAYRNFADSLKKGEIGVLPKEIDGLNVVSIEHEISEFVSGSGSKETMEMKFKQVDGMLGDCQGPGIIVNCGDLKKFVDIESVDIVNDIARLLMNPSGKLWLIGFLSGDDDYKKLLERFPSIEMDLDLHLLPITSSSSIGGKCFKSSLMRSFVPFGGFFSMPSELESLSTSATKSFRHCNLCSEKYEQEVSGVLKGLSTDSVADRQTVNLSSWLQIAECETSKRSLTVEAKEDKTVLDTRVMALQRKWSDICKRLHTSWTSQEDITLPKPHTSSFPSFPKFPVRNDTAGMGSLLNGSKIIDLNPCMPSDLQRNSLPKPNIPKPVMLSGDVNAQAEVPVQGLELNHGRNSLALQQKISLPIACTSSPSDFSFTTALTLGTVYDSSEECRRKPNLQEDHSGIQNSESSRSYEKTPSQVSQSSSCSHYHEKHVYSKDLEHSWKVVAEKVYWQTEAIQTISRTVSHCRNGNGRYHCSNKGNIWFSFMGPDKMGKRKIAALVAEIVFGREECLLSFDLSPQEVTNPFNLIFDCYDSKYHKLKSERKMIVDYLAEELSKHPNSVVLLENAEKADFLVRNSLWQAVKSGKFTDSRGKDININNIIFVLASAALKVSEDRKVAYEFPEEKILEAKNFQMQILVGSVDGIYGRDGMTNVLVTPSAMSLSSKRKTNNNDIKKAEMSKRACRLSRSIIDLNLPVDDMEEESDVDVSDGDGDGDGDDDVWLEELLEQVDENVVFKSFEFDFLAKKILKEIDVRLKKLVGATILLEIDRNVMVQILAAAWLTDCRNALEDWIEQVLCLSIVETCQRCNITCDVVMKLVPCEGLAVEKHASGVCLPARINVK